MKLTSLHTSAKFLTALIALTTFFPPVLQADENPYDVVGKALVPLVRIFVPNAKTQNRAFTAVLSLDEATGVPATAAGQTLEITVQAPDKLKLHSTVLGEPVTVCRNGQDIWAFPGTKIDALISMQNLPDSQSSDFKLPAFWLPITEKQLVFLPVLFQVRDVGSQDVGGETCRALDLTLMPELAHALKVQDWAARIWVRADYHIVKVELARGHWHALISIKSLEYSRALPDETWQPSPDEAPDILHLTPARYGQLLNAVTKGFTSLKQANDPH